jgi:hypothetical protein
MGPSLVPPGYLCQTEPVFLDMSLRVCYTSLCRHEKSPATDAAPEQLKSEKDSEV